ncbi:YciI family protein [Blastococcus sp. SYSU D00669]
MAQYLISMYQPDGEVPPPEFLAPVMAKLGELQREMEAAGAWVFAGGLHDASTATVLLTKDDGEVLITDGPYTEGKEHLGGFTVVEAPDLDGALHWARQQAEITGLPLEVRPFRERFE